jgi:hypothetical protein
MNDHAIRKLAVRLAGTLALRSLVVIAAVWGFVWGTAVLAFRVSGRAPDHLLVAGLVGLVPVAVYSVVAAIRRTPSRSGLAAAIDRYGRCDGLVMAAEEAELGDWQRRVGDPGVPSLKWRSRRAWPLLVVSALFVATAFLLPERLTALSRSSPLEVGNEVEDLADQIDVLEEEELIDAEQAEGLELKLAQIRDEAIGEDPVKTWESLDHLADKVTRTAEKAAEDRLAQTEEMTQAQALAEALAGADKILTPEVQADAMAALDELLKQMARESEALAAQLGKCSATSTQPCGLTAKQLSQIAAALKAGKLDISCCLANLADAKLIDVRMLEECRRLGQCNSDGLAAFLAKNCACMKAGDVVKLWCRSPGRGGVDRGRADAPMTWRDEASEQGAKFQEQALPPASLQALRESSLAGVSAAAPEVTAGAEKSGGALSGAAAGGGSAHTRDILPRHRGTVGRYFERKR